MNLTRLFLALPLLGILASALAQPIYREVPLDAGGWVSGFAQHSSGRLYGYGDIFGVYRSDDFGANWRFLQAGVTEGGTFIVGLAVHPQDAARVAYSTYGHVFTSTDSGDNWTRRLNDLSGLRHTRGSRPLAYHPTQPNELWLAANRSGQTSSLWRTTNQGLTWTAVGGTAFSNERATTIHFFPASPNEVWVGTAAVPGSSTLGGLWCSADGGTTWTKVWNNNGQTTEYYGTPQVNTIARNPARVSVFSSNDGVWQVTATDWAQPTTYTATQRTWDGQNIPNVTALANGSFWASEMGDQTWAPKLSLDGVTWTDRQITHSPAYVPEWSTAAQITASNRVYGRDMMVQDVNNPNRWLLTGGASAHLSEDNGITWRYQPGGMAGIATYRVNFDRQNSGRAYIAASDHGIFVVNDGGLSGRTVANSNKAFNELHTFHEVMVSADGQTIVGAGVHQGISQTVIVRSTDGGTTWAKLTPTGLPTNYEGITRAVMSSTTPNDYLVLLGFTDKSGQPNSPGLYRTTNGGTSFAKVGGTTFDNVNTGMRYHPENAFLERDGINASTRYLALRADNKAEIRGVWRSTDGGTTWTLRSDPFGGGWIRAFAVDPTLAGRLWAASNYLRRSDDGGATWTTVSDFIQIGSLDAYAGRLVVGGRRPGDALNKIYHSYDNGQSWQDFTSATNRFMWAQAVYIDPWRAGQVWVTGSRSVQLIDPPAVPNPLVPPVITAGQTASGMVNSSFSYQILASNNPSSFTLASGTLPTGVVLNAATGLLSGTPTSGGSFTPGFNATNAGGTSASVAVPLQISPASTALAYENFNQVNATQLSGASGGSGWIANWTAEASRYRVTNPSGLTYSNLVISGGFVEKFDQPSFGNSISRSFAPQSGRVWASVLVNFQQVPTYFEFKLNQATNENWSAKFGINAGNLFTEHSGGNATATSAFTPQLNQTYLLVLTYSASGAGPTAIYVNPDLGVSSPVNSIASAVFAGTNWGMSGGVGQISMFAANGLMKIDEIRIGSTFAEVTPILSPSTGIVTFRATLGLPADGTQDQLTPANDGVANLLKYAFNMLGSGPGQAPDLITPNATTLAPAGTAGLPFVSTLPAPVSPLQITYIRRLASSAPGITYVVQFSDDLVANDWAINPSATETTTSLDTTFERVLVADSIYAPARRFARVQVVATP